MLDTTSQALAVTNGAAQSDAQLIAALDCLSWLSKALAMRKQAISTWLERLLDVVCAWQPPGHDQQTGSATKAHAQQPKGYGPSKQAQDVRKVQGTPAELAGEAGSDADIVNLSAVRADAAAGTGEQPGVQPSAAVAMAAAHAFAAVVSSDRGKGPARLSKEYHAQVSTLACSCKGARSDQDAAALSL